MSGQSEMRPHSGALDSFSGLLPISLCPQFLVTASSNVCDPLAISTPAAVPHPGPPVDGTSLESHPITITQPLSPQPIFTTHPQSHPGPGTLQPGTLHLPYCILLKKAGWLLGLEVTPCVICPVMLPFPSAPLCPCRATNVTEEQRTTRSSLFLPSIAIPLPT